MTGLREAVETRRASWLPRSRSGAGTPVEPGTGPSTVESNSAQKQSVSDGTSAPHHPWRTLGFFVTAALIAVSPVLRTGGWPRNHEVGSPFIRTEIYAHHLSHWDLLPIWSSSDSYGLGSPLPLYYHKLFYFLSGTLVAAGWSVKAAVVVSIVAFMLVGMYGMRTALLRMNVPQSVAVIGAAMFVFANYSFTDWIVRGDVAEFSAMMLTPWLLCWCVEVVTTGVFRLSLVPVMVLLFLAHSVLWLFSAIPIGLALGMALILRTDRRALLARSVVAGALWTAVISPLLLLHMMFDRDFDLGQALPPAFRPENQVHPMRDYLLDRGYTWMSPYDDYTVAIDRTLWVALIVVVAAMAVRWWRTGRSGGGPPVRTAWVECYLAALFIVLFCMQLKPYLAVYRLPMFAFIQFPWRLLAFMTPALILLVLCCGVRLLPARTVLALSAAMVAVTLFTSPVAATVPAPTLRPDDFTASQFQRQSDGEVGSLVMGVGEYLPVVRNSAGRRIPTEEIFRTYQAWGSGRNALQVLSGSCSANLRPRAFEADTVAVDVVCTGPARIALPVTYNSYTRVDYHGARIAYRRLPGDPRIVVDLPSGAGTVRAALPTTWRILRDRLSALW